MISPSKKLVAFPEGIFPDCPKCGARMRDVRATGATKASLSGADFECSVVGCAGAVYPKRPTWAPEPFVSLVDDSIFPPQLRDEPDGLPF